MNWPDYESAWQRQSLPSAPIPEASSLKNIFEAQRRQLATRLLVRDLIEAGAGLLIAALFARIGWHLGREGWPMVLAVILLLGVSVFFVRERLRTRRLRLGSAATLLAKVEADLTELRHQHELLSRVARWYLGPCALAILLFALAVLRSLPPSVLLALVSSPLVLGCVFAYFGGVLPLCFWGIWRLNRRAVRRIIEPRLAELETLQRELVNMPSS
jgi:hypothetical protein